MVLDMGGSGYGGEPFSFAMKSISQLNRLSRSVILDRILRLASRAKH